jgi:hypothetical protein
MAIMKIALIVSSGVIGKNLLRKKFKHNSMKHTSSWLLLIPNSKHYQEVL